MRVITACLAIGVAMDALSGAAPAAAQYPGPGYGYDHGYAYGNAYPGMRQIAVNRCSEAVQAQLSGEAYGRYDGPGGGRVLGISQVAPRGYGGAVTVRGVASSGRYAGYGYVEPTPVDLVWQCMADFRGMVLGVSIEPVRQNMGGNYNLPPAPYDNDYSQYGYRRY